MSDFYTTVLDKEKGFDNRLAINIAMSYLFKKNYEIALRYSNVRPNCAKAFNRLEKYIIGLSK